MEGIPSVDPSTKAVRIFARLATVVAGMVIVAGLVACSASPAPKASVERLSGERPLPALVPAAPNKETPEAAVKSYLDWITYAYRIGNSDVASSAFSAYEEVRVNSYLARNVSQGRALDQVLMTLNIKEVRTKGSTSTVSADESWKYRYFSIRDKNFKYISPEYSASYDTTYTVIKEKGKGWVVDQVEAKARGEVK